MSLLKKKKKVKDVEEVKEEVKTEEIVDEEIQTTFNDDQEGILEDAIIVKNEEELNTLEEETEDC